MKITRRALTAGLIATPFVSKLAWAQSETIKIGMIAPMTGAGAETGKLSVEGANLALDEINQKGVLGRKLELVVEDDQTTNPGSVLAFSKLVSQPDIVAFLGSTYSTRMFAMEPDIRKAGKPMLFGSGDPTLTTLGNPWLFRCRPHAGYDARAMVECGVNVLSKKKWIIIHSSDSFGTTGAKNLAEGLKAAGAEIVMTESYNNQQQDFTPVILRLRGAEADVLGSYFTFGTDLAIFARQRLQLGLTMPWVGSASNTGASAMKLAGAALGGTYAVTDFTQDANPAAARFSELFKQAYKTAPDIYATWPYDAVHLFARAFEKTGGTEPDKVRDALISIKDYEGIAGRFDFDAQGEGVRDYSVVQNEGGALKTIKRIQFDS